jgi:protein O-mannosyl-transferase
VNPAASDGLFSSPARRSAVLGLLLVLATLALYNPVSHHPFVNYDDDRYVTDNVHVRAGLHWETVKWAFTTYDEANWHPLTWLSHALDFQVFGMNPAGHHYENVLLHALNAMLLFWLLWQATGSTWPSLMVAALFAVHPINVESVAWVAERKTVLSMTFFLLTLLAYGRYVNRPSVGRYAIVTAVFACGLMAKPMVITLPFVLLLWDYWPLHRTDTQAESHQSFLWLLAEKIPLFALSLASAIVTVKAQRAGDAIGSMIQYPMKVRLGNAVVSYAGYLGKAFWPSHLAPMYPLHENFLTVWPVLGATLLMIAITVIALRQRNNHYLLMGWLWFLGTLVPMIGLVQVGRQSMADRYAYLPFVGIFIAVCFAAEELVTRKYLPALIATGAGLLILGALATVTHRQLAYWSDNLALWTHTVEVTKDNFIAEDNLGGALLDQGRLEDAMPHFRAAAAIEPADPMSHLNLAANEQRHGHYQEAMLQYAQLVQITSDPRFRATAFSDMGYGYRQMGDLARARQCFQAAVVLRPRTLRAWVGLGLVDQKLGNYAAAVNDFSRALAIQRWDLGYFLLARALEQSGRAAESQAAMQQARQLSDNFEDLTKVVNDLLK